MEVTLGQALNAIIGSGVIIAIVSWIRFRKKDVAQTHKVQSETDLTYAEAESRRTDNDIKVGNFLQQFAEQLSGQLLRANKMIEKKQEEIDRLHVLMQTMRDDFEKAKYQFEQSMAEMETIVAQTQKELSEERLKNSTLIEEYKSKFNAPHK